MWQLQTTEHTNQDNNQSILIKGRGTNDMALIPTIRRGTLLGDRKHPHTIILCVDLH